MTIYAFPSGHNPQRGRQEDGMTLRDYFAAKAMPHCQLLLKDADDYFSSDTPEIVAKMAYVMADEMLKVRDA